MCLNVRLCYYKCYQLNTGNNLLVSKLQKIILQIGDCAHPSGVYDVHLHVCLQHMWKYRACLTKRNVLKVHLLAFNRTFNWLWEMCTRSKPTDLKLRFLFQRPRLIFYASLALIQIPSPEIFFFNPNFCKWLTCALISHLLWTLVASYTVVLLLDDIGWVEVQV